MVHYEYTPSSNKERYETKDARLQSFASPIQLVNMLQVNPSYFKALDLYGLSIGDIPIIRDIYSYAKSGLEALKLSPTA